MVHPSTDNFRTVGLGSPRQPFCLGVYLVMRAFKIVAAALLVAAVAAATPGAGTDREHILGSDASTMREHILSGDMTTAREHIL
ncbi:hypothetical protein GCM10010178_87820 [Lentzea flava]|uniref:Uncharacterized protein n=1 Tax=Lentzea flava TaxID=103732 RepID=A0ABQ2VF92_9PSEU|nr:hypothetical protein [Lentzea flava]GGU83924.1 hypothetical protein GCM10010178_87820 [Lentzea flava]